MRDTYSHKSILESLSAFLMPCTTIETCSMAGFSCGWLLQATFWGLSSQEGCSIEALPNYLPGVHQRKSSLGHSVLQKMLYLEGETTVSEPSLSDTLSGNTGKTNLLKIHHTMKTFQSMKHWEAQTPISKLKIPLEKGRLARTGGMTDPHIARRFTRMSVWLWNGST